MRTSIFRVIQTFRANYLRGQGGTGDRGSGAGDSGTSRGKRPDIEHIGLHWIHTFRVDFFRGTRDRGQGTRDSGNK